MWFKGNTKNIEITIPISPGVTFGDSSYAFLGWVQASVFFLTPQVILIYTPKLKMRSTDSIQPPNFHICKGLRSHGSLEPNLLIRTQSHVQQRTQSSACYSCFFKVIQSLLKWCLHLKRKLKSPQEAMYYKNSSFGVPVVAQWLTNPTRNPESAGLILGLVQWAKDPALPWAVV